MLPLALAAVAQAVVVIAGGIDLSIGSMMALVGVVSAALMKGQCEEFGVAVVVGVLVLGIVLGAINGGLVVITRVPDIVVTLAMSFVWAGCALLVLKTPGGGSAPWLKELVIGSLGSEWIPKAAVVMFVVVARRSGSRSGGRSVGLSIYAIGSNRLAAFRSGVSGRADQGRRLRPHGPVRGARRAEPHGEHRHRDARSGPLHAVERRGRRPRRGQPRRWAWAACSARSSP